MSGMECCAGSHHKYTYEDYLKLPEDRDYEVIGGELVLVPRPQPYHQKVAYRLFSALEEFAVERNLGEAYGDVDVVLGEQVVSPDVIFITRERLAILGETNVCGAPDLVVEVVSSSTRKRDRKEKSRLYFEYGVKEYWLVDPEDRLAEVFVPGARDWQRAGIFDETEVLVSPLLPGLEIDLKRIFRRGILPE